MSITRKQALSASAFHESDAIDPQTGHCVVWHSTGHPATWGPDKRYFSVPVVNDADTSGNITEVTAGGYHVDEDCPHGYTTGNTRPQEQTVRADLLEEEFGGGEIADVATHKTTSASLGSRDDFKQRVLRRQLAEKIDEIQQLLGFTDLQMMEVVSRWLQHKVRAMRDLELDET